MFRAQSAAADGRHTLGASDQVSSASELSLRLARRRISYRKAVMTSSPTLPARRLRWVWAYGRGHNPIGVEADWNSVPQGSRGGNPGLEVATASRYLIRGSFSAKL